MMERIMSFPAGAREDLYAAAGFSPGEVRHFEQQFTRTENPSSGQGQGTPTPARELAAALGDARNPPANNFVGDAFRREGNPTAALEYYNRATALAPNDPNTWVKIGQVELQLGNRKRAEDDAVKALRIDPSHKGANDLYNLARQKVDPDQLPDLALRAKDKGKLAFTDMPLGVKAPVMGGLNVRKASSIADKIVSALGRGDHAAAVKLASEAVDKNALDAQALNLRAIAYSRMKDYQSALRDVERSLKISGDNVPALLTYALVLNRLKRFEDALKAARRVLELDPNNTMGLRLLAYAQAGLGDRAGMLDSLARAAKLDPSLRGLYERALRLPQSADALLLFQDEKSAFPTPAPLAPGARGLPWWVLLGIPLALVLGRWRRRPAEPGPVRLPPATPVQPKPVPAPVKTASRVPGPGDPLGDGYRVIREIGAGSLGVVYEATELPSGKTVAVKRLREELHLRDRDLDQVLDAARHVLQLKHPNSVQINAVFLDEERIHIAMEYIKGPPLSQILEERGALPPNAALRLAGEIALALDFAHGRNILHGDLRPSNVFMVGEGLVKVADFQIGIQVRKAAARLAWKEALGNPAYLAPEQELGATFKESDVFALGVLLYEMLTGQLPFEGPNFLAQKRETSCPKPSLALPGLPPAADAVILNALAPEPQSRFHSAGDLCSALASSLGIPAA